MYIKLIVILDITVLYTGQHNYGQTDSSNTEISIRYHNKKIFRFHPSLSISATPTVYLKG